MTRKAHKSSADADRHDASAQDRPGLERLIFFSDGVFAIAATLLALDIRLPAGQEEMDAVQLLAALLGIWHKYLAYLISFLVIGFFWTSHHRKFRFIKRYDRGLFMLNLLFLMVIAFVPFPTSVISEYGNRTGTIFYALTMILAGLVLAAIWWHAAWHNRLLDPRLDPGHRRQQFVGIFLTIAVFVLSIGIAFIDDDLAKFSWLLILPVSLAVKRT
jgi:uncharacterized membrane protein